MTSNAYVKLEVILTFECLVCLLQFQQHEAFTTNFYDKKVYLKLTFIF